MWTIIIITFLLINSNLIKFVSSIHCYTCGTPETGYYCTVPFNIDDGDESEENPVSTPNYDADYYCQTNNFFDPETRAEKLILRGIKFCEDLNVPNHRIHCCRTDYCNKYQLPMDRQIFADSMSVRGRAISTNDQHRFMPSIFLLVISSIVLLLH